MELSKIITATAVELAKKINADAILLITETGKCFDEIIRNRRKIPLIAATPSEETFQHLVKKTMIGTLDIDFLDVAKREPTHRVHALKLITRSESRDGQIEDAIGLAMNKGILVEEDTIVVVNSSADMEADAVFIYKIRKEKLGFTIYDFVRKINVDREVFEAVLNIALELGREGRGGGLIGTAFLLGDSEKVMELSRQLILNPFEGQAIGERLITNPEMSETIKEMAQLDGAFVINSEGIIQAAGRYLNVDASKTNILRGLGTRHAAVAAVTSATDAVGITVSQSGGIVRIFKNGNVAMAIEPHQRIASKSEIGGGTS